MNRRQYLASLALPLLPITTATATDNPKRLPVLKMDTNFERIPNKFILNEDEIFGKMSWRKEDWSSGETICTDNAYPYDKPYFDQTAQTRAHAVRETLCWLKKEDWLCDDIFSRSFFWGEVRIRQLHRGYRFKIVSWEKYSDKAEICVNISPTDNSRWFKIQSHSRYFWQFHKKEGQS